MNTNDLVGVKIIGKRVNAKISIDWEEINNFLKLAVELSPNGRFIASGIYKFNSHDESDKWMIKVLAKN